ncbi:hypothetical protein Back2_29220 [Nocardioides baekrokdamisoli]|uniref:Uncharacterized protein n=1 Tax=Nocardioides baekrokdamisoli TaxID=1804624 RepID=A0A3G9IRP2_9ACTN|nr:hypothetical protein Back2_29220 [Nocardioides baekrokdamisoli]
MLAPGASDAGSLTASGARIQERTHDNDDSPDNCRSRSCGSRPRARRLRFEHPIEFEYAGGAEHVRRIAHHERQSVDDPDTDTDYSVRPALHEQHPGHQR